MMRNLVVLGCAGLLAFGLSISSFAGAPQDTDGDGVIDDADNCTTTPNGPDAQSGFCTAQEDGDFDGNPTLLQQKLVGLPGGLDGDALGVDRIVHSDEYRTVKPGEELRRPLYFPVAEFPVLQSPGKYLVTSVYISKAVVGGHKWAGLAVSESAPLEITKP